MAMITGTEESDILVGTPEDDLILGLDGADIISGEEGDDTIDGGEGPDRASYETSPVGIVATFDAAAGTGIVQDGFGTTDTLINIEAVRGSQHNDTITGGAGGDAIGGLGGDDLLTGGDGFDQVLYQLASSGVIVDLEAGTASDGDGGTDTLQGFERVNGSNFDDVLIGSDSDAFEVFRAREGNDVIDGGGGVENMIQYFESPEGVKVNLTTGQAQDGWGTVDTFTNIQGVEGTEFADILIGDNNDNFFIGGGGSDRINGRGGFDSVDFSFSPTGVFADLRIGLAIDGDGALVRLLSIEEVVGSDFDDIVFGNGADNNFFGLAGNDIFNGRKGTDTATFDGNSDEFQIAAHKGVVTVKDGQGQVDTCVNVEFLQFNDVTLATADIPVC